MKNSTYNTLISAAMDFPYNLPVVKTHTNLIRKEYPYFKRLLRALLGKQTWYEVNEPISPVFNEAKGDEIKVTKNVGDK